MDGRFLIFAIKDDRKNNNQKKRELSSRQDCALMEFSFRSA